MKPAQRLKIGSLHLNVLDNGKGQEPVLLFLHGFPDFHYGWRKQVPVFEDLGYRVIAPDQRGYNLSDKTEKISDYALGNLGQDMLNLLEHLQIQQVVVIAHDWGGAVGWWLAHHHPERVKGLVVLNMPHPEVFKTYLRKTRSQLLKSWYLFFFQLPVLPELILGMSGYRHFSQSLKGSAKRGAFGEQDLEKYRAAWAQPGAFTAMLNWYRAALRGKSVPFPQTAIKPPVLMLWGSNDTYLEEEMIAPSLDRCQQGRAFYLKHAGHWVHHDAAEEVNDAIQAFLKELSPAL